ncbi:hypothetical protein [Actinomadura sp. NTSP31]|uniref:hypothetical protein n=1 Tax=Actinomadura sp. NTSP31 TaxID=1735447 RepID=UPI0035BF6832
MNVEELEQAFAEIDSRITFVRRPDPVPGDLRLGWRFSALVLILSRCRGNSATLQQTHFIGWALRSREARDVVRHVLRGDKQPEDLLVRYDPVFTRTIAIAEKESLIVRNTRQVLVLTLPGLLLANKIWAREDIMVAEKEFLELFPRRMTQKYVRELIG